jgi:hypothetical protein
MGRSWVGARGGAVPFYPNISGVMNDAWDGHHFALLSVRNIA